MNIKLYLKKINQEMIRVGRGVMADCDFYVTWTKECCILDFFRVRRRERGLMIRKEDEGGMLWDPRSGAVYKLDEEAYHTLLELENGFSEEMAAKRVGVSLNKVKTFNRNLKKLNMR